jgi:hypothetical protein
MEITTGGSLTMQLTLTLAPGLTQRHRTLRDCLQTAVIKSKGGVAGIAPSVDMSPSLLGRKLAGQEDDPHRTLDIDDFDAVLSALAQDGDHTPLFWLIEKYLPSDEQRRAAAIDQVSTLMPRLMELMAEISSSPRKRK